MSSMHDMDQFRKTNIEMNKCLQMLKYERRQLLKIDDLIRGGAANNAEKERLTTQLKDTAQEIQKTYEVLEDDARTNTYQLPSMPLLSRLNVFLQDVATSSTVPNATTNFRDAMDWSQHTLLLLNYLSEMLKQPIYLNSARGRRFLGNAAAQKVDSFTFRTHASPLENPHRRFESGIDSILDKYAKDHQHKMRYVYRFLERSTINSVIEFKLMSPSQMRDYATHDRQHVCYFKCLVLVNNGTIDYSQFISPQEDWRYMETNPKQIDLNMESRFDLYRTISVQANIVSRHLANAVDDLKALYQFLAFIGRFHSFDDKCLQCKKVMKDFMPAMLVMDQSSKKASYHSHCR